MRDEESNVILRFTEISERGYPFGITSLIYQEVLQGAASRTKFDYLAGYMGSQTFYYPRDPIRSYGEAARMYFDCRRAGITIHSSIDCLIARVAMEHDLILLHDDQDYEKMAGVIPELTLA